MAQREPAQRSTGWSIRRDDEEENWTLNRESLCKHYEEYGNNTHKIFVLKHNSVVYAKSGPDPNPENRKFICEMNIYG